MFPPKADVFGGHRFRGADRRHFLTGSTVRRDPEPESAPPIRPFLVVNELRCRGQSTQKNVTIEIQQPASTDQPAEPDQPLRSTRSLDALLSPCRKIRRNSRPPDDRLCGLKPRRVIGRCLLRAPLDTGDCPLAFRLFPLFHSESS
jgi:hypothetical protein